MCVLNRQRTDAIAEALRSIHYSSGDIVPCCDKCQFVDGGCRGGACIMEMAQCAADIIDAFQSMMDEVDHMARIMSRLRARLGLMTLADLDNAVDRICIEGCEQ